MYAEGEPVRRTWDARTTRALVAAAGISALLAACSGAPDAAPSSSGSMIVMGPVSPSLSRAPQPAYPTAPAWQRSPDQAAAGVRTLSITVLGTDVTVPSRLEAGTYVVDVATPTPRDMGTVQVARPGEGLTREEFVRRQNAWQPAIDLPTPQALDAYRRWRTSASFLGGGTAMPARLRGDLRNPTPGGVGQFAITLEPGRYWFYAGRGGEVLAPDGKAVASSIHEVDVVGQVQDATASLPVVAEVRFSTTPYQQAVAMPATIPRRGFLRAQGAPGYVATLGLVSLAADVTDAELTDGRTCSVGHSASGFPPKNCFTSVGNTFFLGGVSGGRTAFWYYDLPPGDYAVSELSGSGGSESPDYWGVYTRVHVQ